MAGWSMQRVLHFLCRPWRECETAYRCGGWSYNRCVRACDASVWAPAARRVRRKQRVRSAVQYQYEI